MNLVGRARPRGVTAWRKNLSGVYVDEDVALTLSTYFACIRVISEDIAAFPWHVFRRLPDGNKERLSTSPLERMLTREPNPEMSGFDARQAIVAGALGWGNGYAEIVRDIMRRPRQIWPIHPRRVTPDRIGGALVYRVRNEGAESSIVPAEDMIHLRGPGEDGVIGYSTARLARNTLGLSIAAEQFGSSFFGNGAHPIGVLTHPGKLHTESRENMRKSWNELHQGPDAANRVAILEQGVTYEKIGIAPEDAQFLETRKFQVPEICRWFRVPPHKVQDLERATFSNIVEQNLDYLSGALLPWVIRLELEADRKLIGQPDVFTKLDFRGLLRAKATDRATFYKTMAGLGVLTVNDMLSLEDMNTIGPSGDVRLIPSTMIPLERATEPRPSPPAVPDALAEGADAEGEISARLMRSYQTLIAQCFDRIGRRQAHRAARGDVDEAFFAQHAQYAREQLSATLSAIAEGLGGRFPLDAIVDDYAAEMRLNGSGDLNADKWAARALAALEEGRAG